MECNLSISIWRKAGPGPPAMILVVGGHPITHPKRIEFWGGFKRFYLFLDRGKGREKERERNINVWLPLARPHWGTWPAHALTGNRTSHSLVRRPALNPLSHTSRGEVGVFENLSSVSVFIRICCWLLKWKDWFGGGKGISSISWKIGKMKFILLRIDPEIGRGTG